jgi:hypothetical protein
MSDGLDSRCRHPVDSCVSVCLTRRRPSAVRRDGQQAACPALVDLREENGRGGEIRTHDLYVPNVALYQAKLRPDTFALRIQVHV